MAELKKIIVDGVEHTLPEGGGGTSQVFVDVDSLPTENINSDVIYRLFRVYGYINGTPQTNTTVHIVDALPTIGENCTTDGSTFTNMYYNKSDESVYGYVNATIGAAFGVTEGWYPAANLLQIASLTYGGVVDSIVGLESVKYYFVREYDFYVYKGKWIKLDNDIVFQGEGLSSVVMNDLGNVASGVKSVAEGVYTVASGDYSHAEGYDTTASGDNSHAEGESTTASGDRSHAEGFSTTASGDNSHAEGFITKASGGDSHAEGCDTTASGNSSHAEGYDTTASGDRSHAEGYSTTASKESSHAEGYWTKAASDYQHVQGKYNIEDSSSKYAHIVGNGLSQNNRSNSHTLDWNGNAWYKGNIKTGGTTYDDAPNTVVTSLDTPTDSGQILIGNTDGTAEWSTETLSELSQRITNLEQSGGGGGGVSSVFEDVTALPDSPDGQKIYRIKNIELQWYIYENGELFNFGEMMEGNGVTINIIQVSELPEDFEPLMDNETMTITLYVIGEDLYGYDNLTGSNTWLSNSELVTTVEFGAGYGGFITSLDNTGLTEGYVYFYPVLTSYSYINTNANSQFEFASSDELSELKNNLGVGREGTGPGSEVFNNYDENIASGRYSHAEGSNTKASGYHSHSEGYYTIASGNRSHTEGFNTIAPGDNSHAEGSGATYGGNTYTFTRTSTQYQYTSTNTFKSGVVLTDQNGTYTKITAVSGTGSPYTYTFDKDFVTTEGETASLCQVLGIAYGDNSHAEGSNTIASGTRSHSEGYNTTASGTDSHAEGTYTTASGYYSHAEGEGTTASGKASHAEGSGTIAASDYQHAQGKYNIEDSSDKYAHIVGNGSISTRSNAHTLDWNGNAWFKGNVRVGGTSWDDATELGSGGGGSITETEIVIPITGLSSSTAEYAIEDTNIISAMATLTNNIKNAKNIVFTAEYTYFDTTYINRGTVNAVNMGGSLGIFSFPVESTYETNSSGFNTNTLIQSGVLAYAENTLTFTAPAIVSTYNLTSITITLRYSL